MQEDRLVVEVLRYNVNRPLGINGDVRMISDVSGARNRFVLPDAIDSAGQA